MVDEGETGSSAQREPTTDNGAEPIARGMSVRIHHGQVQSDRLAGFDVARIVKKLIKRAGLDPTQYAGHSLRSGHATRLLVSAYTGARQGRKHSLPPVCRNVSWRS